MPGLGQSPGFNGAGLRGRIVFHADDFGMNEAVNRGIVEAFEHGILTSTSLLANAPAAEAACQNWRELKLRHAAGVLPSMNVRVELNDPDKPFDLGIHLNLSQGKPLTGEKYPAQLLDNQGCFPGIGAVFQRMGRATKRIVESVSDELNAQIEWMCDRGLRPTHLNGHQYVELVPAISTQVPEMLTRYSVPVVRLAREPNLIQNVLMRGDARGFAVSQVKRHFANRFGRCLTNSRIWFADQFFGTAHAGRINESLVLRFLSQSCTTGLTEIGVHPATEPAGRIDNSDPWYDPLANFRPAELGWLCGTVVATALKNNRQGLGRLVP
jgi:predicted glycoside hydrolase/deacetylase ChbG (UPF0249 family)